MKAFEFTLQVKTTHTVAADSESEAVERLAEALGCEIDNVQVIDTVPLEAENVE